jgi:hypothetical protein
VVAPNLGRDLSWVAVIDPRVSLIDGNAGGRQRDELFAEADVALVGFPVPRVLALERLDCNGRTTRRPAYRTCTRATSGPRR